MSRKTIAFLFLMVFMGLLLPHRTRAQQLTEQDVRTTLDQLGQGSATDQFTITDAQEQQLSSLSPDVRASLIQSDSPCVLSAGDARARSHQFVVCQGLFPPGMSPQQSAHSLKLARKFP